jgi:O-antigen/teichoic acid export membrane protein
MLGRQTALGGMLMVGARLVTRLFDLATMLVQARLLQPTDFGLVAIAITLVAVVEAILELPLNQALMRLQVITRAHYDTVFTFSVLRGAALGAIVLVCALPFARFYHDQRLVPLICVLAVSPIARGLTSPRLAEYQKEMSFWRDFAIELAGKSVGFAVGVSLALATHSYWAIAAGTVTYPLAMAVVSYVLVPYRPRFSLSEARVFSGFVGWMSAAQVVSAINWQFERLLLGKLQTTGQLGLFTTASDMANIPLAAFFGPILRPLLAAFAQVHGDAVRVARSYQTASAAVVTMGVPLLVGECLMADPAVRLVLGPQWHGAVPLLQWLAISLIPGLLGLPATPLFMSFGNTKLVLRRNLIEFCFKLPLCLVGGIEFGFFGVIAARFVSESVAAGYCMLIVSRLTGLSAGIQLYVLWRAAASTLVMGVPVMWSVQHMPGDMAPLASAAMLLVTGVVGGVTYCGTLFTLWHVSGRPAGIEAVAVSALGAALSRVRRPA